MGRKLTLREQVKQLEGDKVRMIAELQELRGAAAREAALRKEIAVLQERLSAQKHRAAQIEGQIDGIREMLDRAIGKPPLMRGEAKVNMDELTRRHLSPEAWKR